MIKSGDKVFLKSGSPELTVGDIFDDGSCSVSWYYDNDIKTEVIPLVCLKLATEVLA